ncbi:MAG TPA: hypothetical protein VMB80_11185 [Candidatus Acidoferrum sp.]|nr:hypothetical protein [Candidatus Acidoferrum sp.]
MKKKFRTSKSVPRLQRKPGFGRFLLGASLIALGAQPGQGADALTPEQWFEGGTNSYSNWVTLGVGGLMTSGDRNQAAQGQRIDPGAFGGIEDLHYQTDVAKKTTFTLDGRSIFDQHDYNVILGLTKEDVGYLRFGFENFRTWDSGNGGYIPAEKLSYSLPGGPQALDRGQITFEAGLTKKDLPQIIFKYQHWYRNGDETSTLWGPVHDPNQNVYRVYPGISTVDESYDKFQLDLTHHYKEINYGAGVSYQMGDLNDSHKLTFWQGEPTQQKVTDRQDVSFDTLSTHAFAESWIKNNLFLSTGFMYAHLEDTFSGTRIYGDDFDVAYSPTYPGLGLGYYNLSGGAHQNQYIGTVNLLSLPSKTFTITPSIRVQAEDWSANSGGTGTLGTDTQPFVSNSGRDTIDVTERLDLRYTGVTNWVFSAGGQWTEGQGNLNERGGLTQINGFGPTPVLFATDDERFFQKYFANARWYPARRASVDFGGYYKLNTYSYNNTQDNTPDNGSTGNAYPGFIVYQGLQTWDGNVRLTLHPWNRVTTVSRYEYQYSKIWTDPAGASGLGETDTSKVQSQIIGQNATWQPLNWLALQAGFNYVLSTTKTPAQNYTSSVLNSENNYWTFNFNSNFVLDDKTDLDVGYFYYYANDFQIPANGLALGGGGKEQSVTATLVRRITQNLRWNLKYAFTTYDDMTSGGHASYDAHLIYSSLQYRF